MTDLRKLLETLEDYVVQALDQHDQQYQRHPSTERDRQVIVNDLEALRQALSQPEQEPAAWVNKDGWFRSHKDADVAFRAYAFPLYAAPPKREWVGITKEDKKEILEMTQPDERGYVIAITESKLKDKNT